MYFIVVPIIQLFDVIIVASLLIGDIFSFSNVNFALFDFLGVMSNLSKCFLLLFYYYSVARSKYQEKVSAFEGVNDDFAPKESIVSSSGVP